MPRIVVLFTLILSICLAAPSPAHAAVGDYTVRLTHTGAAHWANYVRGPFIMSNMRVSSGVGVFDTGDYRSWRVTVPGDGAKIIGGSMSLNFATPNALMRVRMVGGTGTGTPTVIYESAGDGNVTRAITDAHDWVQFDLRSTGATRTTSVGENHATLTALTLVLRDSVAPTLTPQLVPPATAWHGASACAQVQFAFGDHGGGLARFAITRADTGAVVAAWTAPQTESPRPGPTSAQLHPCITPAQRGHGDTQFVATVVDVGGHTREHRFSVRADHVAPSIDGGPAAGSRFDSRTVPISFAVADSGAGVTQAHGSINGAAVPVRLDGSRVTFEHGLLALGSHTAAITVIDGAGNAATTSRTFSVRDSTPPIVTVESPGARGDQRAWLSIRVTDDASGVDPTTWRVTLNDETVTLHADANHATATVGPLAPGMHRFDIKVADRAGNVATVAHAYDVVGSDAPLALNVGARSGLFLVDHTKTVISSGAAATATLYLTRSGRPFAGQVVVVTAGEREVARGTSDPQGMTVLRFPVSAPATYAASAPGLGHPAVPITLGVAPRLRLTAATATPKVGTKVRLRGRVLPAIARGQRVVIDARVGGVWYPVRRSSRIGADGRFTSTVVANTRGAIWVRVRLPARAGWAAATSRAVELRVRSR